MPPQPDSEEALAEETSLIEAGAETMPSETSAAEGPAALTKFVIELGPLLVFFGMNAAGGIFVGTASFMIATLAALVFSAVRYRKVAIMPVVSGVVVMVFGGLTLYLQDATFIKLKPTIVYCVFAVMLTAGLIAKKHLLQLLFGEAFQLTEEGWRRLTVRWIVFFIVMAILNEIVWRNFSTNVWVSFKAFGFLPLTFVFAIAQVPLLQRYAEQEPEEKSQAS